MRLKSTRHGGRTTPSRDLVCRTWTLRSTTSLPRPDHAACRLGTASSGTFNRLSQGQIMLLAVLVLLNLPTKVPEEREPVQLRTTTSREETVQSQRTGQRGTMA